MEPSLAMISHIAKDSFDFKIRLDKNCPIGTKLSTCDINHYILTFDMMFFIQQLNTGLKNWKMIYHYCDVSINNLPLKACPLFQNSIIFTYMEFIFIRLKELQWEQNLQFLVVIQLSYTKTLALLPPLYPQHFVDFFISNYFRFLDDIFHKWLDNFDIESFYSMINNLETDLKFIFENPSKSLNFLDINIRIVENNLVFDIHYQPTI